MNQVYQPTHLLTIVDVARRLNVSVSHVYRLVDAGDLPALKVGPRALRIDAGDLADYLAELNGGSA